MIDLISSQLGCAVSILLVLCTTIYLIFNHYNAKRKKDSLDKMAISDDKLFQDPPPKEDCPICTLPMPFASGEVCAW